MPAEILPDPGGDIVQDGPVDTGMKQGPGPLKTTPPSPGDSSPEAREGTPATAGAPGQRELPPKLCSKFPKSGRKV